MAPSYSIGCAATEEHSWGAGDRQSAGGTLSGMREREREREGGAPQGYVLTLVVRRTSASLQQVPNTCCALIYKTEYTASVHRALRALLTVVPSRYYCAGGIIARRT